MLRLGCAVLVMATTFAAAGPSGKVVRVERARAKKQLAPILCEVKPDLSGECIGGKPAAGDVISVVDGQKVIAEVRVLTMAAMKPQCDVWQIKTAKLSGDLTTQHHRRNIGVVDADLQTRGRYIDDRTENQRQIPNADPSSRAQGGVDRDGDGTSDIVVTLSRCGGAADPCIEIWSRRDRTMVRTWAADLANCY